MKKLFFADELNEKGCKHCVSLIITKPVMGSEFIKATDKNGTLTFVEFERTIYGVTCQHVVDDLRKRKPKRAKINPYTFFVIGNQQRYIVEDCFRQPKDNLSFGKTPDIAMRIINPGLVTALGKEPVKIGGNNSCDFRSIKAAIAVGYPNIKKEIVKKDIGDQISAQCMFFVAENGSNLSCESLKIHLASELESSLPLKSLGGISGGPIFWSNEKQYGLLGFVENRGKFRYGLGSKNLLHIEGILVTEDRWKAWLASIN